MKADRWFLLTVGVGFGLWLAVYHLFDPRGPVAFALVIPFALTASALGVAVENRWKKKGHRPSAFNCRYWTGDKDPVDWGTCGRCPDDRSEDG